MLLKNNPKKCSCENNTFFNKKHIFLCKKIKFEIFMIFIDNHIFLHISMSRNSFSICWNLKTVIFEFSEFSNFLHFLTMFTNIKAKNYHSTQVFPSTKDPVLSTIFFEVFHKLFVFKFQWSNIFKSIDFEGPRFKRFSPQRAPRTNHTGITHSRR